MSRQSIKNFLENLRMKDKTIMFGRFVWRWVHLSYRQFRKKGHYFLGISVIVHSMHRQGIRSHGDESVSRKFHFCFVQIDTSTAFQQRTMSIAEFPWPELFPVNILPGGQQLDIIKNPANLRGAPSTAKLHVKLGRTRTSPLATCVRVRARIAIPQNLTATWP